MKQSKKLLSVILAIIMVFSSVSVLANAREAWLDGAISYNSLDEAVLTTEQYATAGLDDVDRMLAKEDIVLTQDEIFVGTLDATSIDNALDSVNEILNGSLWTQYNSLLGDLKNLNISALTERRRSSTDVAVINSLLKFLYDNSSTLIVPFVKGELDMGAIVAQFVPKINDLDVTDMAREKLYEATYETDAPATVTATVDTMVQDLIDRLVEEKVTSLVGCTNISSGSAYDFIDNALKTFYNNWAVPNANTKGIDKINELLEKYSDEVSKYRNYFNLTADGKCNFTFQPMNFTSATFFSQLNNVIASIVNVVLSPNLNFTWETGDNSKIVTNIIRIGREVLAATGDTFFEPYVEVKTPAELAQMTDMQVCAYVARTIINSSIDSAWVPNTADTLIKVANYTVKDIMATEMPERDYSSTSAYPVDSVNTLYNMLADFGVKALNDNPGLGLSYGIGVDALAKAALGWVIDKWGGLLSGITLNKNDSAWTNADKLLKVIFDNYSWFDASQFPNNQVTFESFVKNVVMDNVLNLNFTPLFNLLSNKPSGSELQSPVKTVILRFVARTLNLVFPGFMPTNLTTFEQLLDKNTLGNMVGALFSDLYNYRATLVPSVLPIVDDALGFTTKQKFKTPTFDIEDFNYVSTGAANIDFKITNRSSGINTAYTKNGVQRQDSRYAIKIRSITCAGFSVSTPTNSTLSGGESTTVKITGAFTGTKNTKVVVTYDVLTETGATLTSAPLVANIYTCISKTAGDAATEWETTTGTYQAKGGLKNIYKTSISGLDDLTFKIKNTSSSNVSRVGTSTATATTISKPVTDLSFVQVNTDPVTILAGGVANYQPYVFKDNYSTSEAVREAQEAEAFGTKGYQKFTHTKTGVTIGSTAVTTTTNILLYKDYGLTDLFYDEVNAQRQASDYSSSAWSAYVTAMDNAAALVQATRSAAQFISASTTCPASKFEAAATALETAVETLKASATGGVTTLKAYIDTIEPSNDDLDYDEAGYDFSMSAVNFKTYTWSNYRKESREANSFVKRHTEPDEKTGVIPVPTALDVAYKQHRLALYYDRLIPVTATKTQLNRAVGAALAKGYVSTDYTADSWDAYQRAINFAHATRNASGVTQKQINVAYEQLVKAQKRLIEIGDEPGGDITITAAATNPGNSSYKPVLLKNSADDTLLLGVYPEATNDDLASYFNVQGGSVTFNYEKIATGETVTVKDSSNNIVLTFKIVLLSDVDGDGDTTVGDITKIANVLSYLSSFGGSDSAFSYAADVNGSSDTDVGDITVIANKLSYLTTINYAAAGAAIS